jgi:phosphoglucomutase
MARVVAERNGAMCFDTFTGFKFMAEKKAALEAAGTHHVIFSYEESYGYMIGDYVRDKDAVTASLLLAEMAASYAAQGMTLYDALPALYAAYGRFGEKTLNLVMPGIDGLEKMKALMASLRKETPKEIGGVAVSKCLDYLDGVETDAGTGACVQTELSGSNVLRFTLSDGTAVLVRPSGTEPKIKIYILARGEPETECKRRLARCAKWAESLRQ